MMKKIYAIIALTIILLVINICLTLYINNDAQYYEANYLSHYYKLKNMPTIIPIEYEEPEYEYDEVEEYYFQNMEDIENNLLLNNNIKFNDSNNKLFNFCYSLLNEFLFCLSPENDKNYKCKKLFYEKLNELEKCDIINFNNSKNSKKEFIFFNFPKEVYTDVEDEFEKEKKYKEKSEFSLKKDEENEDEEKSKKQILLYNPKNNVKNENANKDCVEYGLTKDDLIICTKYE
jgi:hypothetical protein